MNFTLLMPETCHREQVLQIKINIIKLKLTTIALMALILSTSCKKDEYVNLKATISGENVLVGTTEGSSLIYNISLSEELSEDLPINLTIDTSETIKYINEDDYDPIFEYSSDLGRTWKKGTATSVIFPKRTRDLKVRLHTIDDEKLEVHEEFTINFSVEADKQFSISGSINPIKCIVEDNEENMIPTALVIYSVGEDKSFTLLGINRDIYNSYQKSIIDNGLEQAIIDDVIGVTSTGEVGIKTFEALFDAGSGLGGYVYNNSGTGGDEWHMTLNLSWAYYAYDLTTFEQSRQEYNANGAFGYILTHEYGHIMTLNQLNEIDGDVLLPESCTGLYLYEGCFKEASALNRFHTNFYDESIELNEPSHVTDYAQTNIAEDIAESFAYYVGQDDVPASVADSSGALNKVNFVANHASLKDLKEPIQSVANVGLFYNSPIRAYFNRTVDGEKISCTDHKKITHNLKQGMFKLKK